jgi:hypothetical protein
MKSANPASGTLQVLLLALLGLFFYVFLFGLIGLIGGMIISRVAHAQSAGDIDSSFTGSWFDPAQGGQGLMLEVLPDNHLFALWFAFDPAGKQSWFGGVGTYSGNTATITAALPTGGRWIRISTRKIVSNTWGTLTFSFADHDHGRVDLFRARLRHRRNGPAAADEHRHADRQQHTDRFARRGDRRCVRQRVFQQQP